MKRLSKADMADVRSVIVAARDAGMEPGDYARRVLAAGQSGWRDAWSVGYQRGLSDAGSACAMMLMEAEGLVVPPAMSLPIRAAKKHRRAKP